MDVPARDGFLRDLGRGVVADVLPTGVRRGQFGGLVLSPAVDVLDLAEWWEVERPVVVSTDVHQQQWWLLVAGEDLPDAHGHRIASAPPRCGDVEVWARLTGRPSGPLPGRASGASPAYDARVVGGLVDHIELRSVRG